MSRKTHFITKMMLICDHAEYYINDQTFLEGLRGPYG